MTSFEQLFFQSSPLQNNNKSPSQHHFWKCITKGNDQFSPYKNIPCTHNMQITRNVCHLTKTAINFFPLINKIPCTHDMKDHLETLVFDKFLDAVHNKEAAIAINVNQVSCV